PTVSQRTFYARAKRHKSVYEQILAREGARAAYPFKEYHHGPEKTIHRHGSYAWSMAHIDHLEVDLQLCDSKTNQLLGKCWLTLMILSSPRRIAAFYLTFSVIRLYSLTNKTLINVSNLPAFCDIAVFSALPCLRMRGLNE